MLQWRLQKLNQSQGHGIQKEYKKHPGKKRLRRQENWARKKAKMARNGGKRYTVRKGTIHPAKRLKEYNQNCMYLQYAILTFQKRNVKAFLIVIGNLGAGTFRQLFCALA